MSAGTCCCLLRPQGPGRFGRSDCRNSHARGGGDEEHKNTENRASGPLSHIDAAANPWPRMAANRRKTSRGTVLGRFPCMLALPLMPARHFSETRALVEHQHFRVAVHGPERACTSPRTRDAREDEGEAPQKESTSSERPRSHREQRERYLWGTFGPPGLMDSAASSALQQWRDVPSEWGQSKAAYAKRFVSEYAESAIGDSTKYLIARLFDEDPSFRPCACTGLVPRLRHASVAPFRARKSDGRTGFSFARIAGVTASNVAASTWYPAPRGVSGVARHIAIDFAGKVGVDLLREFLIHRRAATPAAVTGCPRTLKALPSAG